MQEFRNNIAILISLDRDEIGLSEHQWRIFRDQPFRFFLQSDAATLIKIWQAIERRQ